MALHYFIDGYNLIWSTHRFSYAPADTRRTLEAKLRDQREHLLRYLERSRPLASEHNSITVVFDGKEDVDSPPWRGAVKVVFSRGEDADAVIKRRVEGIAHPRDAVVVTDDRDIQRWVRASRARVLGCAEFLRDTDRGTKLAPRSAEDLKPDVAEADRLNEELKRIWRYEA